MSRRSVVCLLEPWNFCLFCCNFQIKILRNIDRKKKKNKNNVILLFITTFCCGYVNQRFVTLNQPTVAMLTNDLWLLTNQSYVNNSSLITNQSSVTVLTSLIHNQPEMAYLPYIYILHIFLIYLPYIWKQ